MANDDNLLIGYTEKPIDIKRKVEAMTYTVPEVADMLGCGEKAVRDLCHNSTFPSLKIGKGYKIPKSAFHEWLEKGIFATKESIEKSQFRYY